MPKVPPPSPEDKGGRPRSRGKRRRTTFHGDSCRCCGNASTRKATVTIERLPEVPTKLPVLTEDPSSAPNSVYHFSNFKSEIETDMRVEATTVQKTETVPVNFESKKVPTDKSVTAHGKEKKKHNCQKKEVVIAPFKVTIHENAKSDETSAAGEGSNNFSKTTITKPFTFSYMPSAVSDKSKEIKRKKRLLLEEELSCANFKNKQKSVPVICNDGSSKKKAVSEQKSVKSSLISSFISANQSQVIYRAIVAKNHDQSSTSDLYSLNKGTDCDGIDDLVTTPENRKVKGQNEKSQLSPLTSIVLKRDSTSGP